MSPWRGAFAWLLLAWTAPACALTGWWRALEGELTIAVERVEWQGETFSDVRLPLRLERGAWALGDGRAGIAGGTLLATARHDRDGRLVLAVDIDDVELGALARLRGVVDGAPVDGRLEIEGRGSGGGDLLHAASGRLQLASVGPGQVNQRVERAGSTVFGHLFGLLAPFSDAAAVTELECVAADLRIADARLSGADGLALRTRRLRLHGGGTIDLARGEVLLALVPEARTGIDLGSLNLVERVLVEGPLDAPRVEADTGGVLRRAATLGASVALIGRSALRTALAGERTGGGLCPD